MVLITSPWHLPPFFEKGRKLDLRGVKVTRNFEKWECSTSVGTSRVIDKHFTYLLMIYILTLLDLTRSVSHLQSIIVDNRIITGEERSSNCEFNIG